MRNNQTTSYQINASALTTLRRVHNLTQFDIADLIGKSQGYIWRVEKGRSGLSRDELLIIARKLGVPPDVLVVHE